MHRLVWSKYYIGHIAVIKLSVLKLISQVHKATIEGYTGEGSPPHIEMMITAASDKTTPPDLTVEAKLKGVNEPNIIQFEKEARNVVECVYQVFYHKIALNHWRARVAFFPKNYLEVIIYLKQSNELVSFVIMLDSE